MNLLKLSAKLGFKDLRVGKLTLIIIALILATTAFTTQAILSSRLQQTLIQQVAKNLGGDLVISSPNPVPTEWQTKAQDFKLNTQKILLFPTMLYTNNKLQLVNIEANNLPELNTIWIDSRLANMKQAKIGVENFKVSKILSQDFENMTGLLFGPCVMMNMQDVAKTKTLLPGSRVEYRLILNGPQKNIAQFRQWLNPKLTTNQRLLDIHNQQFMGGELLNRADQFLSLATLMCLVISLTAFILGTKYYLNTQKIKRKILYNLGLPKNYFNKILFIQFLFIFILSSIAGIFLGYLLQAIFASYLPISLASAGITFPRYSLNFMIILFMTIIILYLLIRSILFFISNPILKRFQIQSIPQMIGFSLVIASVVLLYQLRTDLFNSWQNSLSPHTPNYFVINIDPIDKIAIKNIIPHSNLYPMIRGRLIELNHKPIFSAVPDSAKNNNALHRELNLSYMDKLPADNKIITGNFWTLDDHNKPWISIENKLAQDLGIKINDQLTFQIGDQQITGIVKNFRLLDWNSFHPNFYIIFPPGILNNFPTTYMTSFYLPDNQKSFLNLLSQQFPNITIIDASNLLKQIKTLLIQSTTALQYAFLLAFIAGIILLITMFKISLNERRQAYYLMRVLGASRKYIYKKIFTELGLNSLIAGTLGILMASLISFSLAHFWLNINYYFSVKNLILGYGLALVGLTLPSLFFLFNLTIQPKRRMQRPRAEL